MIISFVSGLAFFILTLTVFFAPEWLEPFDAMVARAIQPLHTPAWSKFFGVIAFFGSAYGIILVSIAAVGATNFSPLFIELGLITVVGSAATAQVVKIIVARMRPERLEWRTHELEYSYPSGHSTAAAACYGLLACYAYSLPGVGVFIAAFFVLLVLGIGISRVALSVHYASDVAGGYLLALSWLFFALVLLS